MTLTSVADEQQLDEVVTSGACGGPFVIVAGPKVAGSSSPGLRWLSCHCRA
jgi:hypothetical protein